MYNSARPAEASGWGWILAGKRFLLRVTGPGVSPTASQLSLTLLGQRWCEGCCYTAQWEGFQAYCECVQDP